MNDWWWALSETKTLKVITSLVIGPEGIMGCGGLDIFIVEE
jgi:hypothetical protein